MFNEIPKNCRYDYGRVSFKSQEDNSSLEAQKEEFIQQGVPKKNIRFEVESAADPFKERPVFQKLIEEELKENDLLLVTKIDRCSRNTLEFLKLQDILFKRNITFVALDLPNSIDLATNKLIATTFLKLLNLRTIDEKSDKSMELRLLKEKVNTPVENLS